MHPERRLGGNHGGTDVEGCSPSLGDPVPVQEHQFFDGIQKQVRVHRGHAHPLGRAVHPFDVCRRPEKVDLAVLPPVGFQPFENFLAVMEAHGGGIELDRAIWLDQGIIPAAVRMVFHIEEMVGDDLSEPQLGFVGGNRLSLFR